MMIRIPDLSPLRRPGRSWPPVDEDSFTLDALLAAVAHVAVAFVSRGPNDRERRELELQRMRLENLKLEAEIEVLRKVEIAVEEDDEDDADDADQ